MLFDAFGSAAKPGAGNSSKIVKHRAVQGGAHNRLYIDKVQPCEGFERATKAAGEAKAVKKMTDNKGGGSAGTPSATTDKVFLLSTTEVYGDIPFTPIPEGFQYEYHKFKGDSGASSSYNHWPRSVHPSSSTDFRYVGSNGAWHSDYATYFYYVFPAWCF